MKVRFVLTQSFHEKPATKCQKCYSYKTFIQNINSNQLVTETINPMKRTLDRDSILREEKGQWWVNIDCIMNCRSSI